MSEETTKRVNYHKNGNLPLFCIEKDTRVGVLYAPFACVLVVYPGGGEPEGAKRRNSGESEFTRKAKRQPEGSTAEQWALKNARDSPENKTKQPQKRLFFGVPGGSRTLDTRRRRPVLYPTELRIRL